MFTCLLYWGNQEINMILMILMICDLAPMFFCVGSVSSRHPDLHGFLDHVHLSVGNFSCLVASPKGIEGADSPQICQDEEREEKSINLAGTPWSRLVTSV